MQCKKEGWEVEKLVMSASSSTGAGDACPGYAVYKNEIVRTIFRSEKVGNVLLDLACTNGSYTGRMYVCSNAVCFYSNLFNFERKLCFHWKDMIGVQMIKASAIEITVFHNRTRQDSDERESFKETHLFSSIVDRDKIFNMIEYYHLKFSPLLEDYPSDTDRERVVTFERDVYAQDLQVNSNKASPSQTASQMTKDSSQFSSLPIFNGSNRDDILIPRPNDTKKAWDDLKNYSFDYFKHVAQKDSALPHFSIDDFESLFIADDAPHSISALHQKLGDQVDEVSSWVYSPDKFHGTKSISFRRSVPGYGNSIKSHKSLHYRRFGDHGICIDSNITSKGSPFSDYMFTEHRAMIEKNYSDGNLILTAFYHTIWTKDTLLKAFPEKAADNAAILWFKSYAEDISSEKMRPRSIINDLQRINKDEEKKTRIMFKIALAFLLVTFLLFVCLIQLYARMRSMKNMIFILHQLIEEAEMNIKYAT